VTTGLLPYFSLFLILVATLELLVGSNSKRMMASLAVLYLGLFLLVINYWSIGLSAVKLVAGWMALAILAASQGGEELSQTPLNRQGVLFRIIAALVIWLLVFLIAPSLSFLTTLPLPVAWSGLILIGMGLLQLGMTTQTIKVIIGLLTVLAGFEIFYATIESSVLVAGLLAMITIGLAAAGAYLITLPTMDESL
jgi:hypothetical protein